MAAAISVEQRTLLRRFFRFEEPDLPFGVLESVRFSWRLKMGRGLLLWLLGVPIPVILLLWLFFGR